MGATTEVDWASRLEQSWSQLRTNPSNAYAASQVLMGIRKCGRSTADLSEARRIWEEFGEDKWTNLHFSWICYDVCKEKVHAGQLHWVPKLIDLVLRAIPHIPDKSDALLINVARQYRSAIKAAKNNTTSSPQLFARLLDVGERLRKCAVPHLSTESGRTADGKALPSDRDQFLDSLRVAAEKAGNWEYLKNFCSDVLEGRVAVIDAKWFGKSFLDSLPHVSIDQSVKTEADHVIQRYGDDEHVQLAFANWRLHVGDQAEAEVAFHRALALARAAWSWKEYAYYVARKGSDHFSQAAACLRAALSIYPRDEIGKVWKIHFALARVLVGLGEEGEAAEEVCLARMAREVSGWRPSDELERFVPENQEQLADPLARLEGAQLDDLWKSRRRDYHRARDAFLADLATPHVVKNIAPPRAQAWIGPVQNTGQDAILRLRPNDPVLAVGEQVLAITVPSWDRKKERPGLRVAWWKPLRT